MSVVEFELSGPRLFEHRAGSALPKGLRALEPLEIAARYDPADVRPLFEELRRTADFAVERRWLITVMSPGVRCYAVAGRVAFRGHLDGFRQARDADGEPTLEMTIQPGEVT